MIVVYKEVFLIFTKVIKPREENVELMTEIENLKTLLGKLNSEKKRYEFEKQELLSINFVILMN